MKHIGLKGLLIIALVGFASHGYANILVNDTWQDGTRTDPASPVYAENNGVVGTDADNDGDIESAWFASTGSALTVPAAGDLRAVQPVNSLTWLTYFTPESTKVNLGVGDTLKITWVFTPSSVNTGNTSLQFPLAIVNTPVGARRTSDGSPAQAAFAGYAMFMNMGQTLGNSTPFSLQEWVTTSGDLLSSSGNWGANGVSKAVLANGATSGNHGFDNGTQYTFTMTFTHNLTNGLDITATMIGGTYNNSGTGTVSYTDSTPNSFTYDTFALRPSAAATSAGQWDTSLFKVEYIPGATPPSIDLDPQDQSVFVGDDAPFNVQASGTAPLFYQWYFNTNSVLTGETNSTLTVTNAQTTDAGGYSAIVSNAYGSVTSAVAQLTVNLPVAPTISTQPQDQLNVLPGATAQFTVESGGSDPLIYQWYFNDTNAIANANDSILTITNVGPGDVGSYSVAVSNSAGTAISSNAVLTIDTNGVAPVFNPEPASEVVLIGGTASFTGVADGTAPITYQWSKDNTPIPGATSTTLTITNAQATDDGNYTITASNSVGVTVSDPGQLTVTTSVIVPNTAYNLIGFANTTTGGGVIATNDPAYRQCFTALDLANALVAAKKTAGSVKVIEIMNDLNLGWNEIGTAVQSLASTPFRAHNPPKLHPVLLVTGMSLLDIQPKSGLTIFSANGSTIRHCNFNPKGCTNLIIRNLKFDQNWEWDEQTKGQYDENDWDFITIGNGGSVSNIWIDHCTFTKSYDGIVDTKAGSSAFTLSWCKYTGDDGATNPNSWVWQQINALESNKSSYAFYGFLRNNGFSTTDIVTVIQGHDKTHLAGQNDLDSNNATLTMTFHHLWLINVWDRCVPRLRAGNVHDYNVYADATVLLAAKNLRNARAAAMSTANQNTLNNTYSIDPPMNGAISTENGALLLEKSVYLETLTPLRNNQTDPSNPAYTGKILGLDDIYQKNGVVTRGNSTDPGSQLGPFQAPIIAFSWNLPGNQLPYTYTTDDPAQLQAIVTSPTAGAGAGVLTWNKTNWLATSYSPTAPVIGSCPTSLIATTGQNISFTVFAGGSAPVTYQWYFNTNTPIANATNTVLTVTSVQSTNVGTYSIIVSNSVGTMSCSATLALGGMSDPFASWQSQYFGSSTNPASAPDADPFGKGMSNTNQFLAGINPTNPASAFRVISAVQQGNDVLITWTTAGAHTNAVQASTGDGNGGYATNFIDLSGPIIIPGSGDATNNYTDIGGITNGPSRYYRVRLVP